MGLKRLPDFVPTFPVPMVKIVPGTDLIKDGVYVYECPLCRTRLRFNDRYEPMCTGPSPTRDEHTPEVMRLVAIDTRVVQV